MDNIANIDYAGTIAAAAAEVVAFMASLTSNQTTSTILAADKVGAGVS